MSVKTEHWQRISIENRSEMGSISCSRTSSCMTQSECGDSLSNASVSLTRDEETDDERSSRIRESLKRELKQI